MEQEQLFNYLLTGNSEGPPPHPPPATQTHTDTHALEPCAAVYKSLLLCVTVTPLIQLDLEKKEHVFHLLTMIKTSDP